MAAVLDYLQGRGDIFTVIPHRKDETASGEIRAAGMSPDEIAKTVAVITNFGPALMVVPASCELDMELAAEATKDADVRLATARELERAFPGYEPGALPPLSMLLLAPMYVDSEVAERTKIVFLAGRLDLSVRMSTHDLFGADPVVITPLTAQSRLVAAGHP
jgi:Ala-tRNA(Pro) deacylase